MVTARRRAILLVVGLAAVLSLGFASPAQASAACRVSDFRNADGTLNVTSYLACVQGTTQLNNPNGNSQNGTLPITGSDSGQLVGLAVVLVALGGAAAFGSRKLRVDAVSVSGNSS